MLLPAGSAEHSCLPCAPKLQAWYQYQDKLALNPTWNCTAAYSTDAYDYYTGTSSYLQTQNATNYIKNTTMNKYAWAPVACSNLYVTICEVSGTLHSAPTLPAAAELPAVRRNRSAAASHRN